MSTKPNFTDGLDESPLQAARKRVANPEYRMALAEKQFRETGIREVDGIAVADLGLIQANRQKEAEVMASQRAFIEARLKAGDFPANEMLRAQAAGAGTFRVLWGGPASMQVLESGRWLVLCSSAPQLRARMVLALAEEFIRKNPEQGVSYIHARSYLNQLMPTADKEAPQPKKPDDLIGSFGGLVALEGIFDMALLTPFASEQLAYLVERLDLGRARRVVFLGRQPPDRYLVSGNVPITHMAHAVRARAETINLREE